MIRDTLKNKFWRKSLKAWAADAKDGSVDRREFLALATIFGASTAAAYGLLGIAVPCAGACRHPEEGRRPARRHVRQGPEGPTDLRLAGNGQCRKAVPRLARHLHPRIHLRAGAAREMGRQRRRDRIHPACASGRDLEQRRRVHRRRRCLQSEPLDRPGRGRQFDGRAHGRADRSRHQEGARGRDHQSGRPHGEAQPEEAGYHHHPRHVGLSGPDRPPRLREGRVRPDQASDRHGRFRARLLRGRQEGDVQAAHQRQVVGRRGPARWRRIHRLRPRHFRNRQRLRIEGTRLHHEDRRRLRCDHGQGGAYALRRADLGDDRRAHQRQAEAIRRSARP